MIYKEKGQVAMKHWRLGIDIGGTFTDILFFDESSLQLLIGKVLTTSQDPSEGVIRGFRRLMMDHGLEPDEISHAVHATTLVSNAIIEKKGARTALITTEGFRDTLLIGREKRYAMYDRISSEVAPEIREFERTSTAVANAYVKPLVDKYLSRLEEGLSPVEIYMMLSHGGIADLSTAREFPVKMVESGPTAGALVSRFFGELSGEDTLVAFDMGGTTAKVCTITKGSIASTYSFEVARVSRFKKGSGLPLKIPGVELIEIGAGGGSVAHLDTMGLLKVGPESASAEPGPACYGLGGDRPTVTDANLLLGYLNPSYFLGGEMALDAKAAIKAMEEKIGGPLNIDNLQAAWGIHLRNDQ